MQSIFGGGVYAGENTSRGAERVNNQAVEERACDKFRRERYCERKPSGLSFTFNLAFFGTWKYSEKRFSSCRKFFRQDERTGPQTGPFLCAQRSAGPHRPKAGRPCRLKRPSRPFQTAQTGRLRAYCHQSMSSSRIPRSAETAITDQNAPLMSATAARTIRAMCRFFMLSPLSAPGVDPQRLVVVS